MQLRGPKKFSSLLPTEHRAELLRPPGHSSPRQLCRGRVVAYVAPRVPPSPIQEGRRKKDPARETRLDEITVLVVSVEAINTHEVGIQPQSPWQPHLPGSVNSEGGAQGDGC